MQETCIQCGYPKSLCLWVTILLLVGGLVHAIPQLYSWLSDLTGGIPVIQIIVGIISVILAIVMMAGSKKANTPPTPIS